jgi:alpha-tubulin suppressor-like RCC1 family protein
MKRQLSLCGLIALAVFLVVTSPDDAAARTVDDMGIRTLAARISSGPSVGANHTCAVKADGGVRCWGANGNGQLGDQTLVNRTSPVGVSGIKDATAVAAGDAHTCARLVDGTVICWGANADGQLGDGTLVQRTRANVTVIGVSAAVAVASGQAHTCAVLANGTVSCWGRNTNGQLGNGTTKPQTKAAGVSGLTGVAAVAVGGAHTCALGSDGSVKCWGDNALGQLGLGTTVPQLAPAAVALDGPAMAIAAGMAHTCALLSDGSARCWGLNENGQLGDGTVAQRTTPTPVSGLAGAVAIEAGSRFTCAKLATGIAACWGRNAAGQLGDGSNTDRLTPVATVGLTDAVAVAGGNTHTCALQANDAARCWGDNALGQLGNGTTSASTVPQVVGGGAGTISARGLAANLSTSNTCARRADGTLACWGSNSVGQLGFGPGGEQLLPVTVLGVSNVVAAGGGSNYVCALDADGAVSCWGANLEGQLGDGTTTSRAQPGSVVGLPGSVATLSAGALFNCAVIHDGTVSCWGRNSRGQVGDGTLTNRPTPVPVPGLEDVVALATGAIHACALLGNGQVRCWGANTNGQLGDGTTTDRPAPTPVVGLPSAVAVAAGAAHTCAVLTDGTARCWGRNHQGQLGIGVLGDMTVPVTPLNLNTVALIASGFDHTCAALVNGEARCWGDNGVHQATHLVGDQLSPATVALSSLAPLRSVTALALGNFHTCALQSSGAVYCWGANNDGQLGDGTTTDRQFPVEVASFRFNIAQSAELQNGKGRVARVTALMNCPEGAQVHVEITLTQDGVTGHGHGNGKCTGLLEEYEVTVPAHGRNGFEPGAAVASADAVVKDHGRIVDTQEWTRSIELEVKP